jgi:hypothetical protein
MVQIITDELRSLLKTGRCLIRTPEEKPEIITHFYLDGDMMVFVNESISDIQAELFEQHQSKITDFSSNILKQFNRFKWATIIGFSLLGWLPGLAKSIDIYETVISYLLTSGLVILFRKLIMNFVVNLLSIRFSDKVKSVFKSFSR